MKKRDTRIADFATVVAGGTPRRGVENYYGGTIPWVKTLDLNCGIVSKTDEHITEEGLNSIRGEILPRGSVMVAMYGGSGTIGKSGVLDIDAATNQAVASILPNPSQFDSDFLHYQLTFLRAEWMLFSQGNRKDPNISKSVVEDMFVWLPTDVAKQRRIAVFIKAQLAEAEKARQAAEAQLADVSKLADAIIVQSLNEGMTDSHRIGDVLSEVKHGIGKDWQEYAVLGATRGGLAPAKEPPGKHAVKYKPAFAGTVFYNPMRILIGSIAFVDEDDTPGITSPDYVVLQGREGLADSRWFYYWLRSHLGVKCISSLARGAVRERMLFNRLAQGEITLPDYTTQRRASAALKKLNGMRIKLKQQLDEIALLPQKILSQAFEN